MASLHFPTFTPSSSTCVIINLNFAIDLFPIINGIISIVIFFYIRSENFYGCISEKNCFRTRMFHYYILLLLFLARLVNRQVKVFCGFGLSSPYRFYCQCGRLRRAVNKVVDVMRGVTTVMAMVACCRVDSVHVLIKDTALTGAQLCQYCSCFLWQCLLGCSNGRWSAIKQF